MNSLHRLWGAIRNLRVTTEPRYPGARHIPYNGHTVAGVFVTPDRALMQATVWAAHRYLTQTVGQLPARIMRQVGGSSERVNAHPVDNLLCWRTNPELAPFQFKETMVGWALLHGNGVAEIETDQVGRVVALWPIEPSRVDFRRAVEPLVDAKGTAIAPGELVYQVNNQQGGKIALASRNVFHLRGFGDDAVGLSVAEYAAQSIGWARATELFGASFFGNGLNVGSTIELAPGMDDPAIRRLMARLDQGHRGPDRANKPLLLDSGMKWEKTGATPDEAQFVATMQHQVEEICRWMGVPPHKVMHLLRATFSNIEHQSIEVVVDAITPWAIRFEEECNFKLFGQNRAGLFVKLDLKGLLRGDFKTRQEGLQIQRRNGIINGDFWAEVEDIPKAGPAAGGQIYIIEGNMTRLDQVGEKPAPAVAPSTPPSDPANENDVAALVALAEAGAILDMADAAA